MTAGSPGSPAATWPAFLDAMERDLQAVERIGARSRGSAHFSPPSTLGPLPVELADRAREVLGAIEAAQAHVRAEMTRTARQLREMRQMSPAAPRVASALDLKA